MNISKNLYQLLNSLSKLEEEHYSSNRSTSFKDDGDLHVRLNSLARAAEAADEIRSALRELDAFRRARSLHGEFFETYSEQVIELARAAVCKFDAELQEFLKNTATP